MPDQKPGEEALQQQVKFLMTQLRIGAVDIHQFMRLLGMAYGDYLDFHPEERPSYYDKPDLKRSLNFGKHSRPEKESK